MVACRLALDSLSEALLRGGIASNAGLVGEGSLLRVGSLRFGESVLYNLYCIAGGISGPLRDDTLPYSNTDSAERSDNQQPRKPDQSPISCDLRSCELVLLILASLAGCLLCVRRCVKNERIPFAAEWFTYIIVFLIGQGAVYLLCKRLYER